MMKYFIMVYYQSFFYIFLFYETGMRKILGYGWWTFESFILPPPPNPLVLKLFAFNHSLLIVCAVYKTIFQEVDLLLLSGKITSCFWKITIVVFENELSYQFTTSCSLQIFKWMLLTWERNVSGFILVLCVFKRVL